MTTSTYRRWAARTAVGGLRAMRERARRLPDGPITASSGEPTSRATSSATSRSRPKKYSAWAASNVARPRNGHTAEAGAASCA
jgi:hypothetical protein